MMKFASDLRNARLNMVSTAEIFCMTPGHLRRLVRRGVFPEPKRTAKGMPFYDYALLEQIRSIMTGGVGLNDEEISFHRRKKPTARPSSTKKSRQKQQQADLYVESLLEGLRQCGVPEDQLVSGTVSTLVVEEFGQEAVDLEQALPVIARRLLAR